MTAPRRLGAAAAGLILAATLLPAQELTLSAGAGGFFPSRDYRTYYGGSTVLAGDVWLRLKGALGFATGVTVLSDRGTALGSGEAVDYPLRFRRTSIPLLVFYELKARPFAVRLGAGAAYHVFRETWPTVDLDYRGHAVSPRVGLTVSAAVVGRMSIFSSAAYEPIRAGADSPAGRNKPIGGFQVLGGLLFRVFSR